MLQKLKNWFNKSFLNYLIVFIGFCLLTYIIIGLYNTRKWCISDDLDAWKDIIEFIGLTLGPYIAAVGLYYVSRGLSLQNDYQKVQATVVIFNRLESQIRLINSEYELIKARNTTVSQDKIDKLNLLLRNHLNELLSLSDYILSITKYLPNQEISAIHIANIHTQINSFLNLSDVVDFNEDGSITFIEKEQYLLQSYSDIEAFHFWKAKKNHDYLFRDK